jgi:predicted protein tyrosine phosphatase
MKNILFICSQNKLRSPTAERLFEGHKGIDTASAGLNHDAVDPVTPELLEWADIIFVMEQKHKRKLSKKFQLHLKNTRVVCLDIPDNYSYMDPQLIDRLTQKVTPLIQKYLKVPPKT